MESDQERVMDRIERKKTVKDVIAFWLQKLSIRCDCAAIDSPEVKAS